MLRDLVRCGHRGGVVDDLDPAVDEFELVLDVGRGGHQREVVLALEAFSHDLHVQQAEEAAAEPEPQCARRLRFVGERRVVETQPLERFAQARVLVAVDRVEAAEHHRLGVAVAGELLGGVGGHGDGLTDARLTDVFDPRDEVADLPGPERGDRSRDGKPHADLLGFVVLLRLHVPQATAAAERAVEHAHRAHHAAVRVVDRVEDEGLERRVGVALGWRDARDQRVEQRGNAFAGLRRDLQDLVGRDAEDVLDLARHPIGLGRGEVDLVQCGDDREVVFERQVTVRQRLGFDALRRVDQQQCSLARSQAARHLVAEVDVTRRVDEVEDVVVPVEADVLGFDGDPALPLEVHRIEVLRPHVARVDRPGELEDAVGEGRLPVIDMGDDAEVAEPLEPGHTSFSPPGRRWYETPLLLLA